MRSLTQVSRPLFFQKLCDLCMSAHTLSPSLLSKLFPKSSSNPNEYKYERSKSMHALIHEFQRFRKKVNGLYSVLTNIPLTLNQTLKGKCFFASGSKIDTCKNISNFLFTKVQLTRRPGAPGSTPVSRIAIVIPFPSNSGNLTVKLLACVSIFGTKK